MLGLRVKRKADRTRWTITAAHGGEFVLSPEEFGTPEAVPYAVLLSEFDVKPGDLTLPKSEADVLRERDAEINRTINQTYGRAVSGKPQTRREFVPAEDSPEGVLRKVAEDDG